jgi:hypothetical protein
MKYVTILPVLFMLVLASCGETKWDPAKAAVQAKLAGGVAAAGWVLVEKPKAAQIIAVKFVLDDITKNMAAYQEGGFKGALPGIKAGIDKALPGEDKQIERLMAYRLAETLVGELDALFARHPDWKTKGAEVAGIVSAFTAGARDTLDEVK